MIGCKFSIMNRYYRRIVRSLRPRGVGRLYPLSVHTWLNLYDISRLNLRYTCYWSMHQVCTWYKCTCIHWYTVPIQSYTKSTLKIWQYSQKIARLTWYCIWIRIDSIAYKIAWSSPVKKDFTTTSLHVYECLFASIIWRKVYYCCHTDSMLCHSL